MTFLRAPSLKHFAAPPFFSTPHTWKNNNDRLNDAGHVALIAGGWVRDELLGRDGLDVDIATSAVPQGVAECGFEKVVSMPNDTLIVVHGGVPFEVTPFRGGDGGESGGGGKSGVTAIGAAALASAAQQEQQQQQPSSSPSPSLLRPDLRGYAAAALDARLRDFTVNALLCDPVSGTVLDWVGGRRDLSAKLLRCCRSSGTDGGGDDDGSERLREDPLRCLRAVRFSAGLGLAVAPETAAAVRELAPLCCPEKGVAAERVWKELVKLSHYEPERPGAFADGMRLASELGVLQVILPAAAAAREEESGGGGGRGGGRTAAADAALRRLPSDSPAVLRVATALPDSAVFSSSDGGGAAASLTLRFKLSKKETRLLETLSALRTLDESTAAVGDDEDEDEDEDEEKDEPSSSPPPLPDSQDSKRRKTATTKKKKRDTMAWVRFYAAEGSAACVAALTARVADDTERCRYALAHSKRLERLSKGVERAKARTPVVTARYAQAAHGLKPGKEMGKLLALAEEFAVEQGKESADEVVALMKDRGL